MTTRFSQTMTDDQLRAALTSATWEEIEAALAAGHLTQQRMANVASSAHRSGEAISMRETAELPQANLPTRQEQRRTNELITDVLKQLKSNNRK